MYIIVIIIKENAVLLIFFSICISFVQSHLFFTVDVSNGVRKCPLTHYLLVLSAVSGAQWLSGRVLDWRPKGHGFEPHRRHCVVVLE